MNASIAYAASPGQNFPISTPASSPTVPAQQFSKGADWLEKRYDQIQRDLEGGVNLSEVRIVFVGDSITQFWLGWDGLAEAPLWTPTFGQPGSPNYALNLGVAGDRTENTLLRLLDEKHGGFGQFDDPRIQPEIIVLMLGINNIWHTDEPVVEKVILGDIAVITRLQQLRPDATVLVTSLLPTGDTAEVENYVKPINAQLARTVSTLGPNVRWFNLYPSFLGPEGNQDSSLFRDGVHPSIKGYKIWREQLLPVLSEIRRLSTRLRCKLHPVRLSVFP